MPCIGNARPAVEHPPQKPHRNLGPAATEPTNWRSLRLSNSRFFSRRKSQSSPNLGDNRPPGNFIFTHGKMLVPSRKKHGKPQLWSAVACLSTPRCCHPDLRLYRDTCRPQGIEAAIPNSSTPANSKWTAPTAMASSSSPSTPAPATSTPPPSPKL